MRTVPVATNMRVAISEVELRELYIAQGLTTEEIAARFGVRRRQSAGGCATSSLTRGEEDRSRVRGAVIRRPFGETFNGPPNSHMQSGS